MDYKRHAPKSVRQVLCTREITEVKPISNELKNRSIVIAIAIHNQTNSIDKALKSALQQTVVEKQQAAILILDDSSIDGWERIHAETLRNPNIAIIRGHCGSPARARNALLDYVDNHFNSDWVCRLDSDDRLATPISVEELCSKGTQTGALYVLGSNSLSQSSPIAGELSGINLATPSVLQDRKRLVEFIQGFCLEGQQQELPSCNLVLASNCGFRYPNIRSAEDHWLVAELLMLHSDVGQIVSTPLYSIYSLNGTETKRNKNDTQWSDQRTRLAFAVKSWQEILDTKKELLGVGHEGVVWREDDVILKRFYPWAMNGQYVKRISKLLDNCSPHLLNPTWFQERDSWLCQTSYKPMRGLRQYTEKSEIIKFLRDIYKIGVAPLNIKRSNMLLDENGRLVMIDIGKDIVDLNLSRFLDLCARMYGIGILGWSDEELVRRPSKQSQDEALKKIPGFETFYRELILGIHKEQLKGPAKNMEATTKQDVTLLIKACAQDAEVLLHQVQHIVSQLSYPNTFEEVVLLLDSYEGPFLRQYATPNLVKLQSEAKKLKRDGWVNSVIIAPIDLETIKNLYLRWFGKSDISHTHTLSSAPLSSQIWAFENVTTRYVLQCDCDVLVGRKDFNHAYLDDMLSALATEDVFSVGFNIPKANNGFRRYEAEPGEYVPEVRMGLLDLKRIFQHIPLENPVKDERYTLTWHRALHRRQKQRSIRSLRGGDSRTFYLHPRNEDKPHLDLYTVRDLVAQGQYPLEQAENFDLVPFANWDYPKRDEEIVFLLKGSRTNPELLQRCLNSLKQQDCQHFGIILIDDDCDLSTSWQWPDFLRSFNARVTLIRRLHHAGRGENFKEAISNICLNPDAFIVILDQDDSLLGKDVVTILKSHIEAGADLIQLPMFRPDKPLKQYTPNYISPRRHGGGEVWAHLRAFKKVLFEKIPEEYLYKEGEWITPSDYSTMMSLVELANKPVFVSQRYGYLHERLPYSTKVKEEQLQKLEYLMSLTPLG
ncbi:glycosyltransferase [Thalassotalea sp. PLHSN55]|uniref:glycosyltransferase n=1 Tax=Thalassotalea sp. PLHSN55 TaxID=3435888 RepID=UPI003F878257